MPFSTQGLHGLLVLSHQRISARHAVNTYATWKKTNMITSTRENIAIFKETYLSLPFLAFSTTTLMFPNNTLIISWPCLIVTLWSNVIFFCFNANKLSSYACHLKNSKEYLTQSEAIRTANIPLFMREINDNAAWPSPVRPVFPFFYYDVNFFERFFAVLSPATFSFTGNES